MADSIFDPNADNTTRGGLDRFLGPQAKAYSKVPPNLVDGEVEEGEADAEVDCTAKPDEPVCEIERAVDEKETNPDKS